MSEIYLLKTSAAKIGSDNGMALVRTEVDNISCGQGFGVKVWKDVTSTKACRGETGAM